MTSETLFSLAGLALTAAGGLALYAASEHQRLFRKRPPARPLLIAGGATLLAGIAGWVTAWGGLVGGLLALAVWMLVSVALPYALALRKL